MSQRRLRVRDLSSSDVQELRENLTNRDGLPRDLAAEAGLLIADLSYLDTCRTALLAAVVRARYQGIHALMASIAGARVKNEAALACCRALVDGKDLERLE